MNVTPVAPSAGNPAGLDLNASNSVAEHGRAVAR